MMVNSIKNINIIAVVCVKSPSETINKLAVNKEVAGIKINRWTGNSHRGGHGSRFHWQNTGMGNLAWLKNSGLYGKVTGPAPPEPNDF